MNLGALRKAPQVVQIVFHTGRIEAEAAEQPEFPAVIDPADRLLARAGVLSIAGKLLTSDVPGAAVDEEPPIQIHTPWLRSYSQIVQISQIATRLRIPITAEQPEIAGLVAP